MNMTTKPTRSHKCFRDECKMQLPDGQMFEYSGILCRHILTILTVRIVLTLPSHYLLKRWTKNARVDNWSDTDDTSTAGIGSLFIRFNSLCREAIKKLQRKEQLLQKHKVLF